MNFVSEHINRALLTMRGDDNRESRVLVALVRMEAEITQSIASRLTHIGLHRLADRIACRANDEAIRFALADDLLAIKLQVNARTVTCVVTPPRGAPTIADACQLLMDADPLLGRLLAKHPELLEAIRVVGETVSLQAPGVEAVLAALHEVQPYVDATCWADDACRHIRAAKE